MKSIWKYLFAFACVFSAVSLVGEGVVGIDGNSLTSADDLGDIDMEATTIGDLANMIAPDYDYAPKSFGIGYGTCESDYSDTIKKVDAHGVTYKEGGIVSISFKNAVQFGAMLELNNTGETRSITDWSDTTEGNMINADDTATFVCYNGGYVLISRYSKDKAKTYFATCDTALSTAKKIIKTTRFAADANDDDFTLAVGTVIIVKFTYRSYPNDFYFKVNNCSTEGSVRALYDTHQADDVNNPYWTSGETVGFVWDGTYWRMIKTRLDIGQAGTKGIVETSTSTNSTETVGVAAAPAAVKAVREYVDTAVATKVSSDTVTNLVWDIYLTSHRYFYDAVTETTYRQVIEDDFYKLIAVTNVPPSYEVIKALESSASE